jgi:F-type H+-transporting ATPase subunit O
VVATRDRAVVSAFGISIFTSTPPLALLLMMPSSKRERFDFSGTLTLTMCILFKPLKQPPLKLFGTAARYASALYTASAKKSALAAVEAEIKQIVSLANSDKKFKEFMEDPTMARKKKLAGLDEFCKGGKFTETTSNFIKVVGENGRLNELEKIAECFEELCMASRGEVKCVVTTAEPLDAAMLADVTAALKGHVPANAKVIVSTKVDPRIVGGMTVGIGEKYLDLSLLSKIQKVEQLIANPV